MHCTLFGTLFRFFERALELPGTGQKRWRDKPPALSNGELTSALCEFATNTQQSGAAMLWDAVDPCCC
jgi:hypothetical protein